MFYTSSELFHSKFLPQKFLRQTIRSHPSDLRPSGGIPPRNVTYIMHYPPLVVKCFLHFIGFYKKRTISSCFLCAWTNRKPIPLLFRHLFVFSLPGAAPTGSRPSNGTQPCWEDILSWSSKKSTGFSILSRKTRHFWHPWPVQIRTRKSTDKIRRSRILYWTPIRVYLKGMEFINWSSVWEDKFVCQPISAARAWSMSFCSVSACFFSVIAPTMGSPTILPLRSTT